MVASAASRVVVVGAGHAGGAFALALRKLGFGGDIVLLGDEPHPPYERPSLSKGMLTHPQGAAPAYLADAGRWAAEFDLRLDTAATGIDRAAAAVRLRGGGSVRYDALVIATGGRARELPGLAGDPRVRTLRNLDDADTLARSARDLGHALVLGGGVIGLEVAASLRGRGVGVDVVEAGPRLLGRNVPAEAAEWIVALHRRHGTGVRLDEGLAALAGERDALVATLRGGARIACGLCVVGIGIEPGTELAEAAGLPCRNGILVDGRYRSLGDPAVYAVGDVAARAARDDSVHVRHESWAHAQSSARAAALAIMGLPPEPEEVPWFWTEQFGHTLQVAGSPAEADDVMARGPGIRLYLRGGRMVGSACLDAPRDFALTRRLIAAEARLDRARAMDVGADLRKAIAA